MYPSFLIPNKREALNQCLVDIKHIYWAFLKHGLVPGIMNE